MRNRRTLFLALATAIAFPAMAFPALASAALPRARGSSEVTAVWATTLTPIATHHRQVQALIDVRPVLATKLAPAKSGTRLTVTSSAFRNRHTLPARYTQFGAGESPPLHWSKGPAGTRAYVVLVEDAGVHRPQPIFHWVLYNVPATVTSLPANLPRTPELSTPAGAMNGLNIRRQPGYMGPRPPKGQVHPYHFEVFALDEKLSLTPDTANRNAVVDAMKGHVLAEGEIIGYVKGR